MPAWPCVGWEEYVELHFILIFFSCYSLEWQTIDRPLTPEEQREVEQLSSHITVSSTGAWVDYSWGDFKHDPKEVLVRYFDAFLYLANWGSRQLMFRFPADLLDSEQIERYCVPDYIELERIDDYAVLDIQLSEEEGFEWIEGAGWLGALIPLRNDILLGDYRALYLAWLKAIELDDGFELDPAREEPPVPPGLGQLNAALQAFVDLFDLNPDLLKAAAQASPPPAPELGEETLRAAISQLLREECDAFLLRLARNEPGLHLTLQRRLEGLLEITPATPQTERRRTIGELLDAI